MQRTMTEGKGSSTLAALAVCGLFVVGGLAMLSGCSNGSGTTASQLTNPGVAPSAGAMAPGNQRVHAKVALLLPLSAPGQAAVVANGMKQAAELALFENRSPGFQLLVKDTRGTPAGATAAATAALADGAEMVLGPLFAKTVSAVSPIARQGNVPVIAFSNDRRVAGGGTYLLSFMVQEEIKRVIAFAASQGKRQFVALIPENDYGRIVEQAFRDNVRRNGGIVVALERYPPGPGGVLGPAHKLIEDIRLSAESGALVDAMFVPGGPEVLSSLGPVILQDKLDTSQVKLLGTGGWDYPNISRERAFHGGWYAAPDPAGWSAFTAAYAKSFGSSPPRVASLAHNATTIAIGLARNLAKGQRFTVDNLTRNGGFVGTDGIVRLSRNGLAERGLAVLEVQKFQPRVISQARRTFTTAPARTGAVNFN